MEEMNTLLPLPPRPLPLPPPAFNDATGGGGSCPDANLIITKIALLKNIMLCIDYVSLC